MRVAAAHPPLPPAPGGTGASLGAQAAASPCGPLRQTPATVSPRGAVNWQVAPSCWPLQASSASGGGPRCRCGGAQAMTPPPGTARQLPARLRPSCWNVQVAPASRPAQASTASWGGEGGAGAWASASGAMRSERRKPRGRWDGFMSRGSAPRPRSQDALHVVERVRDRSPQCGGSRARGRRVPERVREARAWMPLGFEASRRSRGASRFSRRRGRVLREGRRARGRRDVGWSRLVRRPHCDSGAGGSPLGCRGPRHSGGGRGHAARGAKRAPGSRGPIAPAAPRRFRQALEDACSDLREHAAQ